MRIFLAGATGAIGRRLVPMLVDAGHEVVGTTRSAAKQDAVHAAGATPVVLDALDGAAVKAAVAKAEPDVVVHQLTALTGQPDLKQFDTYFAGTNRLRTEGTDHLLAAARAAGVRRFVAQSYTGWPNPRSGGWVKTEEDGVDPEPTAASRQTVAAIAHVERTVTAARDIDGIVLRYGGFYGPGTDFAPGGAIVDMIRSRKLPIVGGGTGVWSFIHIDDAARGTALAVEDAPPGLYNIVDDEPAPVSEWLPVLAQALGAKPPMRVPAWLVRPMLGEHGISLMTKIRGSSNAKARRVLGWTPAYPSWREGFRSGLV